MPSHRLKALAAYYQNESTVWDIGCDHGLLGLSFFNNAHTEAIHLVDPSIDVIHVLTLKVQAAYISIKDFVKIHHAKGQEIVLNTDRKIVFIAGMGGKEIQEIIIHLLPQLSPTDRLVISPHRNILELRSYLHSTELGLVEEVCIKDDGQFYQILCLVKSPILPKVSHYGDQLWQSTVGEEYRQHQLRALSNHQDTLSKAYLGYLAQVSH